MTFLQTLRAILRHIFAPDTHRYPMVAQYERAANRIARRCGAVNDDKFGELVLGMRGGGASVKPATKRKKRKGR